MALRLLSGMAVFPQLKEGDTKVNQYNYFDFVGTVPPPTFHGIWGCMHFLPLVSNMFLARYDFGTFLSQLTEGGYGFNSVGSPGIDMYQIYIVTPIVKAGIHYIGVGLVSKPCNLFAGNTEKCANFLRTFFDLCKSSVDVASSQAYCLRKWMDVGPLFHPMPSWICVDTVTHCPGVVDKEGAVSFGVHLTHAIIF